MGHHSNEASERILDAEKVGSWGRIKVGCEVHELVLCMNAVMSIVEPTIKTLIHIDLSLVFGNAMNEFRRAWLDANVERTDIVIGTPDEVHLRYIRACLRWFVPGSQNQLARSIYFAQVSHGDWSNHTRIQLVVCRAVYDTIVDERQFKRASLRNTLRVLLPRKPRMYDRKSWTKKEESMCDIGLIQSYHGSFTPGYVLMCSRLSKKSAVVAVGVSTDHLYDHRTCMGDVLVSYVTCLACYATTQTCQ